MERSNRERNQPGTTVSPVRSSRAAGTRVPVPAWQDARTATGTRRQPAPAHREASSPSPASRRRAPISAPTAQPLEARIAALIAVVVIVVAAIWFDRDRFDPAPASGIVPQPGQTSLALPAGTLAEGDLAPNFVLRTPDNEPVELASLRDEVVVLHFWATWCLECRAEIPALNGIDDDDGVTVLGIAVDETPGRVAIAVNDLDVTYPVVVDLDGEVAAAYGANQYPVTVVIAPGGTVQSVTTGPFDPATLQESVSAAGT